VEADPDLDLVAAVPVRRDWQAQPLKGHAVVAADDPLMVLAEDLVDVGGQQGDEGAAGFPCRFGERGIIGGSIDLLQVAVGRLHGGDAVIGQLLDQAVLVGFEHALISVRRLGSPIKGPVNRENTSPVGSRIAFPLPTFQYHRLRSSAATLIRLMKSSWPIRLGKGRGASYFHI
jgi:hypothetical protein